MSRSSSSSTIWFQSNKRDVSGDIPIPLQPVPVVANTNKSHRGTISFLDNKNGIKFWVEQFDGTSRAEDFCDFLKGPCDTYCQASLQSDDDWAGKPNGLVLLTTGSAHEGLKNAVEAVPEGERATAQGYHQIVQAWAGNFMSINARPAQLRYLRRLRVPASMTVAAFWHRLQYMNGCVPHLIGKGNALSPDELRDVLVDALPDRVRRLLDVTGYDVYSKQAKDIAHHVDRDILQSKEAVRTAQSLGIIPVNTGATGRKRRRT